MDKTLSEKIKPELIVKKVEKMFNMSGGMTSREFMENVAKLLNKDVKEAVENFAKHFTPVHKQWMGVEMFSPSEILNFIKEDFGDLK